MRGENFIYFAIVSGFFTGVIYAVFKGFEIFYFLFTIFLITSLFYLISLAAVSFFVKYLDIKRIVFFDKMEIDSVLDVQIKELEKREQFIYESYEFIKKIEEEEIEFLKKRKNA